MKKLFLVVAMVLATSTSGAWDVSDVNYTQNQKPEICSVDMNQYFINENGLVEKYDTMGDK